MKPWTDGLSQSSDQITKILYVILKKKPHKFSDLCSATGLYEGQMNDYVEKNGIILPMIKLFKSCTMIAVL